MSNETPSGAVHRALYIDFNSYFASVEQQLAPELRGKPIAVVPVVTDSTATLAASYEAKACGVKTGTRIYDAKKLCPDLILVRANHNKYIEFHHRLIDVVNTVLPVQRVMSIDEMTCELIGSQRYEEAALELAHRVKHTIATEVGSELRCSIGIAPNTYLAKTATDMQKPDGLVVIRPHELPNILYHLELRDLVGIGQKMFDRLFRAGIYTVEMLCAASKQQLADVWGGIEGERMWARLRGEQTPFIETHKSSISHEHVLEPAKRNRQGAEGVLHRLLQKAATRLRAYGMVCGQVRVKIKHRDGTRFKRSVTLLPTQDSLQFTQLLSAVLQEWSAPSTYPIKVTVELTKLSVEGSTPASLFENVGPARARLNASLDALNARYGKNTVYVGTAWNALGAARTHIAFNHIPEADKDKDSA